MKRSLFLGVFLMCLGCAAGAPEAAPAKKAPPSAEDGNPRAENRPGPDKGSRSWVITVEQAAFSPDGKRVLLAYKGAHAQQIFLRIRDAATGELQITLAGHDDLLTFCSFLPDGERVVSGSRDGRIIVYRVRGASARNIFTFTAAGASKEDPRGGIHQAALSANGKCLLTTNFNIKKNVTEIKMFDLDEGTLVQTVEETGVVSGLAISPDASLALTGGDASGITGWKKAEFKLWKTANGEVLKSFAGTEGWDFPIAFSADGKATTVGKRVKEWPPESDLCYWDLKAAEQTKALRFAGQAHYLHNVEADVWCALVRQKDITSARFLEWSGKPAKMIPLTVPRALPTTQVLSADGRHALVATGRNREEDFVDFINIHIWDLRTGTVVRKWQDKTGIPGE